MKNKYNDILFYQYDGPKYHKKMPIYSRAAQFMPFAALTGYDTSIQDAGREVIQKIELAEEELNHLDEKLAELRKNYKNRKVKITYFEKDNQKNGGKYITKTFVIKQMDESKKQFYFEGKNALYFKDIFDMEIMD